MATAPIGREDVSSFGAHDFDAVKEGFIITPVMLNGMVKFEPSDGLLRRYVQNILRDLNLNLTMPPVTESELYDYLEWLLKVRVAYVRGVNLHLNLKQRVIIVPAFYNAVLNNVGRVVSHEFGLCLVPTTAQFEDHFDQFKEEVSVKAEEMFRFSAKLKAQFDAARMTYATALPTNVDGNVYFMTFTQVQNTVHLASQKDGSVGKVEARVEKGVFAESNKAHPVYALMAAILGLVQMHTVITGRVSYGTYTQLGYVLDGVSKYETRR